MELSSQENKKTNKTKKVVLALLVISLIAVVIIIFLMMYISGKPEEKVVKKDKIFVNQQEKTIQVGEVLLTTAEGENFLAIKELATLIGYEYFNGEYLKFTEDINKCYLENIVQLQDNNKDETAESKNISNIIGLEANSAKIYKTDSESNLDYEIIQIENEVLQYNNELYISIDDVRSSFWNFCCLFRGKWIGNIYK